MLVVGKHNVLLLDEPTNNLDPQAKQSLLEALHAYPGTIILVSHDTGFVADLEPQRAVMMPEGESVYFDEPAGPGGAGVRPGEARAVTVSGCPFGLLTHERVTGNGKRDSPNTALSASNASGAIL